VFGASCDQKNYKTSVTNSAYNEIFKIRVQFQPMKFCIVNFIFIKPFRSSKAQGHLVHVVKLPRLVKEGTPTFAC